MKLAIKVTLMRRSVREEAPVSLASTDIELVERSADGLRIAAQVVSVRADACIYCKSTDQLSNEHIIPYALGGTVQVHCGSCERCRLITSKFENLALNGGAMAHVRRALEYPSRTGHSSAQVPPAAALRDSAGAAIEPAEGAGRPVLLSLPLFSRPGRFEFPERIELELEGMATLAFGAPAADFIQAHDATELRMEEVSHSPAAFARMIAKIAYGWAWRDGALAHLQGAEALAEAIIDRPEMIGAFVGTKPMPYERYPGLELRLQYAFRPISGIVYLEVQPFAGAAGPTYEVILGRALTHRDWRRARAGR